MIKLGIIGTGVMGKNHVRASSQIPDCILAGVFDENKATCKQVAAQYGTVAFPDVNKLLKEVEAVTIATPTATHYEIAKKALEAGKHVLVEKPLCIELSDAKELCEIARKQGLKLAVGHIERHNPVVTFTKSLLDSHEHGVVLSMSGKRVGDPTGKRVRDVGVIYDLGVHEIDIGRYITGSEVEAVSAIGGSHSHRYEDYVTLTLAFASGACANIELNWLTPMKIRKLDITCSKSFIELDYIGQQIMLSSAQAQDIDLGNLFHVPWEYNKRIIPLRKQEPLKLEILDFLNAIRYKKNPLVLGSDGLAAIKVAKAAVQAYNERRTVDVTEI